MMNSIRGDVRQVRKVNKSGIVKVKENNLVNSVRGNLRPFTSLERRGREFVEISLTNSVVLLPNKSP